MERPAFTIGVEEEYLLVDLETRDLVRDPDAAVMEECRAIMGSQVSPEFLKAQVEVGTRVFSTVAEARDDLRRLRTALFEVVDRHGLALIAASTHPFADWADQEVTERDRYLLLARDLQVVVRRLVICGMHVHVGIEDRDMRIDLMNQVSYFLPHLLALSTSSPFWHGMESGLKSYRMSVFRSLPRTGIPEHFASWSEYQRHVDVLVEPGLIEDASKLWWDVRPSARYPTVEMRISDVCTRIEDGITIAALYQSIMSMLFRHRSHNRRWRTYANMLVAENVWRAQRYGVEASLMDYGRGELVPYGDLVEEIIDLVREDALELGCLAEVEHAREIVSGGTSADRQLATYRASLSAGAGERDALNAVVDELITDTRAGV
ncbi:MAG: carboxylate-amine ligase [Actinobacteria bacterium RBG_16_68_21]|nr:MAG: carboxylate-amine ligase [Actinobacteria bacterium RBG_16_68_21]